MKNQKITTQFLEQALLALDQDYAENIILEVAKNEPTSNAVGNLISDTLKSIGDSWDEGHLSLSQVYMSGIICEKIINKIKLSVSPHYKNQPKIAIGVFEDYHLLGKRIVYATLRASGIELMDLGGGLTINEIVSLVVKEEIKILLISVLMLPSALRIKDLKEKLKSIDVKIVVGGAPFRFDDQLWKEIDADYYGKDSAEALEIVNKLIKETK